MNTVPHISDAYQAELKSLRAQIETRDARIFELEQELSDLRGGMQAAARAFPVIWGLTATESAVLAGLLAAPACNVFRYESLLALLNGSSRNLASVHISRIRQKLKSYAVEIETIWGEGYQISAENRRKIETAIEHKCEM